jgi:hypothetical protein
MWPERFGAKEVEAINPGLGPYMASGRLQQSPQPKGGGIFNLNGGKSGKARFFRSSIW